ncbi:MAG: hypothetical protein WBO17_01005 [Sphingorhabdus sp.]
MGAGDYDSKGLISIFCIFSVFSLRVFSDSGFAAGVVVSNMTNNMFPAAHSPFAIVPIEMNGSGCASLPRQADRGSARPVNKGKQTLFDYFSSSVYSQKWWRCPQPFASRLRRLILEVS